MRGRPARVLLIGAAAALLVAAAIGVNVVLLGYANREPEPAGRLSPRTTITTTVDHARPDDDDGGRRRPHGSEPDDDRRDSHRDVVARSGRRSRRRGLPPTRGWNPRRHGEIRHDPIYPRRLGGRGWPAFAS